MTPSPAPAPQAELDRLTARRDSARWTAVVGFGLMMAGGIIVQLALGGALMVAYGATASMYWSRRLRKAKGDPWAYDPELDGPARP